MPHWRSMTDREHLFAYDLQGKDFTVKIAKVVAGTLVANGGKKTKKPIVYFDGAEKGLALNSTNAKVIAGFYSNDTDKWIGKSITLYPTTTEMNGETVECIRVRNVQPKSVEVKS